MKEICLGIITASLFFMSVRVAEIKHSVDRIADALEIIASPPEG